VTIIFQEVGKTTKLLGTLEEGDELLDFVGPLGKASHFENVKKKNFTPWVLKSIR